MSMKRVLEILRSPKRAKPSEVLEEARELELLAYNIGLEIIEARLELVYPTPDEVRENVASLRHLGGDHLEHIVAHARHENWGKRMMSLLTREISKTNHHVHGLARDHAPRHKTWECDAARAVKRMLHL